MARGERDYLPDEVREMPLQTQVAVLYERVGTLKDEVRGLRRALWSFVFSILTGALLFLFSVASGWLGKNPSAVAANMIHHVTVFHQATGGIL
jgi:hypothetical protein